MEIETKPNKNDIVEKNTAEFYSYINFAKGISQSCPDIYFFITNCAVNKALNLMMNKGVSQKEEKKINEIINSFLQHLAQSGWDAKYMSRQKYCMFLDHYFKTIKWEEATLDTYILSNSLLNLLLSFGKFDPNSQETSNYFKEKIAELQKKEEEEEECKMDEEDEEILKQFEKEYENNNEIIDINKIEEPEITAEKKKDNKSIKDKEEDKIQPPNTTQPFNDLKIMKNDDPLKRLTNNRFKTFEEIQKEILENVNLCSCELDFNNLDMCQKHIEEVIVNLRNLST